MRDSVDGVLSRRAQRESKRRRSGQVILSLAFHVVLIAAFIFTPALAARRQKPPEFVQVQIIPSQRLGVRQPPKQQPAKQSATPKAEKTAEKPVEPPPEKKPAPSLAAADTQRTRPRPTPPAPAQTGGSTSYEQPTERQGSPTGSALGTASFGGVAGLDNPNFVYNYYIDQMLAIVGSHWLRPPSASQGLEAMVHFRIQRDGEIQDIELIQPSGLSSFDLASLRAVGSASPLLPLPNSYNGDSLGVNLIFR